MFASRSSDTIPIPFDPPHVCTVRKLTGRECDKAQAEHLKSTIAGRWAAHGWAKAFQRQLAQGTATTADATNFLADPLNGYDRHTLVKAGLVGWDLPDPVTPEAIEDLDDEALDWFAREVLRRTKPALFEDPEIGRKNGPSASSAG
jgi:hypothetical protein